MSCNECAKKTELGYKHEEFCIYTKYDKLQAAFDIHMDAFTIMKNDRDALYGRVKDRELQVSELRECLAASLVEMEYTIVMRTKLPNTVPAFSGTVTDVIQKAATLLCLKCKGAGAYLERQPGQDDPTPYKCEACDRECGCLVGSHFKDCRRYGVPDKPKSDLCNSEKDGSFCKRPIGHGGVCEDDKHVWDWKPTPYVRGELPPIGDRVKRIGHYTEPTKTGLTFPVAGDSTLETCIGCGTTKGHGTMCAACFGRR